MEGAGLTHQEQLRTQDLAQGHFDTLEHKGSNHQPYDRWKVALPPDPQTPTLWFTGIILTLPTGSKSPPDLNGKHQT